MGHQTDEAKGRVKEAAGDLTNNDGLKREGKADRAGGKVKEAAHETKQHVDNVVDKVKDRLSKDRH